MTNKRFYMSEIRIFTMTGQVLELKDDSIPKDKPLAEFVRMIFRKGFPILAPDGGTIFRAARVDFTTGTFSSLLVPKH